MRGMLVKPWIRALMISLFFLFSGPSAARDESLTDAEKLYGLSHFWREASYNFAHWEQAGDLDWDAAYRAYIPRVLATKSTLDYYRELQRFCALLKDGHTNVYLPGDVQKEFLDAAPIRLTELGHKAIVTNVDQLLADQIPIGSEILSVGGRSVSSIVEEDIIPLISTSAPYMYWDIAVRGNWGYGVGLMTGAKGTSAVLEVETPEGERKTVTVNYDARSRDVQWVKPLSTRPLSEFKWLGDDVAYFALNYFSKKEIVAAFEAKLPEFRRAKSIILDIRKNGGGNSGNSAAVVSHFTDRPFLGAAWRTPKHFGAYRAWGKYADDFPSLEKYRDYYESHVYHREEAMPNIPGPGVKLTVPTYVLIGRKTASAAEDFLVMGDKLPHWTYVGEPTYGSTGQPLMMDMPGGGRARISTKRDYYSDGREFIGVGVQPDIFVSKTVDDHRRGRDPVLAAALALAKAGKSGKTSSR